MRFGAVVEALGVQLEVAGHERTISVDVVFSGMWYVLVDAEAAGLELLPAHGQRLVELSDQIKKSARAQHPVKHPLVDYEGPDMVLFWCHGGQAGTQVSQCMSQFMSAPCVSLCALSRLAHAL